MGKVQFLLGRSRMVSPRECFLKFHLNTCIPGILWLTVPVTVMHKNLQVYSCLLNNFTFLYSWSRGLILIHMKAQEAHYKNVVTCNRRPSCHRAKEQVGISCSALLSSSSLNIRVVPLRVRAFLFVKK